MLRRSAVLALRMPRSRRPKERSWEVMNARNMGARVGAQNYRSWLLALGICFSIGTYEAYMQWLRLVARGDTCAACEATRARFRSRMEQSQDQFGT